MLSIDETVSRTLILIFFLALCKILWTHTIQHENRLCVFMGDMNIDLLKCGDHSKTSEYLDTVISHGYLSIITKPPNICSSSATLIDHIYTNDISSTHHSGIIITDVADHFGTSNIQLFKENLDAQNFQFMNNIECPNNAYNEFIRIYSAVFSKSFPFHEANLLLKIYRNINPSIILLIH